MSSIRSSLLGVVSAAVFASTAFAAESAAPSADNPFYAASPLPFHAPPFDKIKDADYQIAIEEGMRRQLKEIDAIAGSSEAPTFANTIVAIERSGDVLTRASKVFFGLTQADANDTLLKARGELAPKLAAHGDAIVLNDKLFARIRSVYDARSKSDLDAESVRLVERYYSNFVRAGATLSEADKTKLRAINEELSKLTNDFQEHLLKDTSDSAVVVDKLSDLDGLSAEDISAAAEAAKQRKLDGKWVLALQNTTGQPVLTTLKNRALRERVYRASIVRGNRGNANDNKKLIARVAQLRAQYAKLLGFPNFAAYTLEDQMAKTPEAAQKLLADLAPAAVANAKAEAAKIQALIDKQKGGFKLAPWDWAYYAEQVRKAEFDLDESQIKPYFELDRVLHDGIFYAATQMYGITFKERKDIPVYNPDVRVFEVFDADGKLMALFYCDYYKRDSKSGGAWMDSFVDQVGLFNTQPVIYNVTNFTKPAPGQPALISSDDVIAMFHEFGHGLHGLFSRSRYPLFAGTNVPRDFVEFPSQFNENWALEPKVFANYAKHYQTGAPMPADLVEKIKKAHTFNQGFATTEYLAAALLDMDWHALPATAPLQDVEKFEQASLKKYGLDFAPVPPRYRTTYFAHVWGGGYAAGYYAYLWSDVLSADGFQWFTEHGGMTRENGQHYRDTVLSRGGTVEASKLYLDFTGRDPKIEPLLVKRGLKAKANN